VDDLLKLAVQQGAGFRQTDNLAVLFLAREVLRTNDSLPNPADADRESLAVAAAVEQNKPGTEQQTGAPSTSAGSTTLTEKTGLAELLNLAIERGAITRKDSGSSYTLQTTPYLIYSKFGAEDNNKTWQKYSWARRTGISATFDQNAGDSSKTGSDFESGEIKYTVVASRDNQGQKEIWIGTPSIRDPEVLGPIESELKANIQAALNQLTLDVSEFERLHPEVSAAADELRGWLAQPSAKLTAEGVADELETLLKATRQNMKAAELADLRKAVASIETELTVRTSAIQAAVKHAQEIIDKPRPQLAFSYGYQRDATTSDYSVFKVILGYKNTPKLAYHLNAEWDINNKSASSTGAALERSRAYSVAADLTMGKFANDSCDFTAAAKWMHPMGERYMAFAQAKLNLYLTRGVTIPIALTYANRTEQSDHSSLRFNAGVAISGDSFLGIARKSTP